LWLISIYETETAAREDLATLSREELTKNTCQPCRKKKNWPIVVRTAAIEKRMASQINWLREQLNVLRTRKFSKNSEQVSSLQISLSMKQKIPLITHCQRIFQKTRSPKQCL